MSSHHPGKTLLDQYMQPNKLSQNKLARALGVPPRRINEIILGKRAITADTALRLGIYFGNSASYWMHIQAEYDLNLAKEKLGQRLHMIQSLLPDETILNKNEPVTPESDNTTTHQQPKNIKRHLMR
jgi:addiction module HigA family antidote